MGTQRENNHHLTMEKAYAQPLEKVAIKYGILMAAALAGFFFLMKALGLVQNLELRGLNIIILFSFVLMAVKEYRKLQNYELSYFKGLGVGILTSVSGAVIFGLFVFIYVMWLNPSFMDYIINNEPFGEYLNPYLVSFTIIFEGTASGFLATYAIMQFYKVSHLKNAAKK